MEKLVGMIFALIVVVVLIPNCRVVEGTLSFKDQCLKWHNEFRMKHQVGPITWNNALAKGAEDWAKYLAANNLFKHASNNPYGENLYMSSHKPTEPCTRATKAFYGEVKYYDFDNPGFSKGTGHFTQVVWKNTKQIGAAYATRKDGRFVVVIRYSPPGNYIGEKQFRSNVLPVKEGGFGTPPSPLGGGAPQIGCSSVSKVLVIVAMTAVKLIF